jgi:hypothetical protein
MLLTSRVFGRKLRAGGADAELLPRALAALRAVHAAGYLVSARMHAWSRLIEQVLHCPVGGPPVVTKVMCTRIRADTSV